MNIEKTISKINNKKQLLKLKYSMLENTFRYHSYAILISLSLGNISLYDRYQEYQLNLVNSNTVENYDIYHNDVFRQKIMNDQRTVSHQNISVVSLELDNHMEEFPILAIQEPTIEDIIEEEIRKYDTEELEIMKMILKVPNKILTSEISLEEKIAYILERYQLTEDELNTILSIILAEAKQYDPNISSENDYIDCYIDSYATTNTVYNRTISITYSNYIDTIMGEGTGTSLYYQSICPGQFTVYESGSYKKYLDMDKSELPGYLAAIDFLYTEDIMHNYLGFRSNSSPAEGRKQFVPGGNRYDIKNRLIEQDLIIVEEEKVLEKIKN